MRVLMVSQDFPPHVGGIQTYTIELARRLAGWCERVEVVAPAVPGCAAIDRQLPFAVRRVRSSTDALVARSMFTVWRRGWSGRFDAAVHSQWTTAAPSLVARWSGGPRRVFVAAHGRELLLEPVASVPPLQHLYNASRRRTLRGVDGVFSVSRYTANLVRDLGVDPQRIHVIPNGVDAARFDVPDAEARARRFREHHKLNGHPCFTTVARLMPHKGIDTGIRALAIVRQQVPTAIYVVVGDGPDAPRLRALARDLGIFDAVRFVGRVSDDEVTDAIFGTDIFALLSREMVPNVEGFGLVLLEAGACGRPVIGARSGGIPDAVTDGDSGLLVEPDDPQATAAALARLWADPDLARRMGEGGLRRARDVLSWDRAARAIYDTIAASLRAGSGSSLPPDDESDVEPWLRQ